MLYNDKFALAIKFFIYFPFHFREPLFFLSFFKCIFYQLLCVQHSCSSTQSWGSVPQFIVEMRDQNSKGCPLLE